MHLGCGGVVNPGTRTDTRVNCRLRGFLAFQGAVLRHGFGAWIWRAKETWGAPVRRADDEVTTTFYKTRPRWRVILHLSIPGTVPRGTVLEFPHPIRRSGLVSQNSGGGSAHVAHLVLLLTTSLMSMRIVCSERGGTCTSREVGGSHRQSRKEVAHGHA